ncbi:hypothetical protein DFH06DRAFT_1151292 [Mycena polygramma]|nr:hypothetical protein DFH06DRAFT_1151292 [Mycena polygramma]
MASQQIRGGCNTIKAQPLRCQTRWFKDGIKRRLGELNAIRKNLAAATLLNRHYIIHITHARDLLQDITARVHQASPETLELHRRLDALRVEDSDAVAQEKELEIQRERLLATLYPDDDETLFSVDNGHLEKQVYITTASWKLLKEFQILAAKQRQVVLQNYVQSARSSSVQEGEVKPSMAPLRFDRELSDSHVLKLMVNAQSKLSQLRDKKLCTEVRKRPVWRVLCFSNLTSGQRYKPTRGSIANQDSGSGSKVTQG